MTKKLLRKIIIFGPQGSGKGTQAEMIAKDYGLSYLSTGAMIREEIKSKTEFGKKIEENVLSGKLAPDSEINELVKKYICKPEVQKTGYILDGYPRNREQQKFLANITQPTDVLVIEITDEEAIRRISGRRVTKSGKTYHVIYNPPPKKFKEEVTIRDDDKPEAIRKRLEIYRTETEKTIREYEKLGIVKRVNGMGSIPEVHILTKQTLGFSS